MVGGSRRGTLCRGVLRIVVGKRRGSVVWARLLAPVIVIVGSHDGARDSVFGRVSFVAEMDKKVTKWFWLGKKAGQATPEEIRMTDVNE